MDARFLWPFRKGGRCGSGEHETLGSSHGFSNFQTLLKTPGLFLRNWTFFEAQIGSMKLSREGLFNLYLFNKFKECENIRRKF